MFLPSMPDIGRAFGVSTFAVQSSLIAFLVAYAAGHLFYGGVADRFGRRPVLLWGLAIYVIASLACAMASSMTFLIFARILQGVGAAGSMVMVRAGRPRSCSSPCSAPRCSPTARPAWRKPIRHTAPTC
jgi:DHA1 family bicyclomycin/chloramphenicol resistance-like MFS transporter